MDIKKIDNKEKWDNFCLQCKEKTFLQSWSWGDFNLEMGKKIWRLGVCNQGKLISVALAVKTIAKRGTFLFVPHGPVIIEDLSMNDKKEIFELLLAQLKKIAKEEKAAFIRVSPILLDSADNNSIFLNFGFRKSPMHASAYKATWKLDVYPPEDDLLKNMRKTTRYLIKKATENTDIVIEKSSNSKDIETFQKLSKEVSRRQKFISFSDNFVKKEFETFSKNNESIFLFGKYKGEIAAGALIIFWSGIAFYHQAASSTKFAKFSIPYLLQWEAIKEAKKRGCSVYDFWGFTDPEKFPEHPWAGPTLFKMGFGGYAREYVKTQDYIISQKYWFNYIIEVARKLRRGL
jgi:lipid II:glycine glycyltransferase (peptidoglycan interpeptide bridge formation enzyme)